MNDVTPTIQAMLDEAERVSPYSFSAHRSREVVKLCRALLAAVENYERIIAAWSDRHPACQHMCSDISKEALATITKHLEARDGK